MTRVFLTGGTGFIGRHVLSALLEHGMEVASLERGSRDGTREPREIHAGLTTVSGDLLEPATYRRALEECDAVVHLAAVTGKAKPSEYRRVNEEGTEILLSACRAAGVERFLFISSIAVKFPELDHYPYARSKLAAERLVQESGLRCAVVRPTIVIGRGSASLAALAKLAALPVIPVPGGGQVRVQPVYAGDLAVLLREILVRDAFRGEVLEIGGPERLSMEELLTAIARALTPGRVVRRVRVPLGPVIPVVALLESLGPRAVPITVGQLSSFRWDGLADSNWLYEFRMEHMKTVGEMLRMSL